MQLGGKGTDTPVWNWWKSGKTTKLVVGLGNPEKRYSQTRHNIGFVTVDEVAADLGVAVGKKKWQSLFGETHIGVDRVILAKPQTYMNLSGLAVGSIAEFYKVDLGNILVIHDDLDLSQGQMRFRRQGGPGGHNGLKSIISSLQTDSFPRLKIGIGRPPAGWEAADYVLQPLGGQALQDLLATARLAAEAVEYFLEHGMDEAMNRYNS